VCWTAQSDLVATGSSDIVVAVVSVGVGTRKIPYGATFGSAIGYLSGGKLLSRDLLPAQAW
jgi:hypothetical protein